MLWWSPRRIKISNHNVWQIWVISSFMASKTRRFMNWWAGVWLWHLERDELTPDSFMDSCCGDSANLVMCGIYIGNSIWWKAAMNKYWLDAQALTRRVKEWYALITMKSLCGQMHILAGAVHWWMTSRINHDPGHFWAHCTTLCTVGVKSG